MFFVWNTNDLNFINIYFTTIQHWFYNPSRLQESSNVFWIVSQHRIDNRISNLHLYVKRYLYSVSTLGWIFYLFFDQYVIIWYICHERNEIIVVFSCINSWQYWKFICSSQVIWNNILIFYCKYYFSISFHYNFDFFFCLPMFQYPQRVCWILHNNNPPKGWIQISIVTSPELIFL